MRNKIDTKRRSPTKCRVALTDSARSKIDGWKQQMEARCAGIRLSDTDIVTWFLSRIPSTLTAKQTTEIKSVFFNEVKELEWKLKQAKAAKSKTASQENNPGPEEHDEQLDQAVPDLEPAFAVVANGT